MRTSMRRLCLALCAATALALPLSAAAGERSAGVIYLDNGAIRVGVDLGRGGNITYLARARGAEANVIHEVQQSYSGADWNASASGGHVLASLDDGRSLYTKVVPRAPDGAACACVLETWVTLRGVSAEVRHRLTREGDGDGAQAPRWQQLPAVLTTGTAYRLFTYDGRAPYARAPVRRLGEGAGGFGGQGASFAATEHWAALVGPGGRGVGLFVPELTRFRGISGTAAGIDSGGVNGFVAATAPEILDERIVYSYRYALVLGTLRQIRAYATAHRPESRPSYRFRSNRRHWWYENTRDEGFPLGGAVRVRLDHDDPRLIGPEQWWKAKAAPTLYVRGAWQAQQSVAELFWSSPSHGFGERHKVVFSVLRDGRFHTYRIRLGDAPDYAGVVTGLRLDPVRDAEIGAFVDVSCISWTPCPVDRRLEARIERQPLAHPFTETFETGLGPPWHTSGSGTGATVAPSNGRVEVSIRADAANGPPGGWIGAHIGTNCRLRGDFDVQVDFDLVAWPAANGVQVFMNTYFGEGLPWESVTRQSAPWGERYEAWVDNRYSWAPADDARGRLRLVRTGDVLTASRWAGARWQLISTGLALRGDAVIALGAATNDAVFADRPVKVALDNFGVNSGRLVCPPFA